MYFDCEHYDSEIMDEYTYWLVQRTEVDDDDELEQYEQTEQVRKEVTVELVQLTQYLEVL
jgi:hypothetical protein